MKKEERLSLLNKALEIYTTLEISLQKLSELLGIGKNSISKYLKLNGIEIIPVKGVLSDLKTAIAMLSTKSYKEVSEETGICEQSLKLATSGLNPSIYKKQIIELAILEYINTPKLDKSVEKTSRKYGINKKTLKKYLSDRGIETPRTGQAISFNEDIFHIIDTEEKAYWLGFMYADGYIESKGNGVGLSLSYKDADHLLKFNNFLDYSKGMTVTNDHQFGSKSNLNSKGEEMFKITTHIRNTTLWNDLNNLGCVPNKSLILTFPSENMVPSHLVRHFIRGYFDGDGTLGLYLHSKTNTTLEESLMFVGTKPFLEEIQKYLGLGFLMQKTNCNELTYRLSYSTTKANKAARIMYDNATIYLQRKYNIYLKYLCRRKIE